VFRSSCAKRQHRGCVAVVPLRWSQLIAVTAARSDRAPKCGVPLSADRLGPTFSPQLCRGESPGPASGGSEGELPTCLAARALGLCSCHVSYAEERLSPPRSTLPRRGGTWVAPDSPQHHCPLPRHAGLQPVQCSGWHLLPLSHGWLKFCFLERVCLFFPFLLLCLFLLSWLCKKKKQQTTTEQQ